MKAVQKGKGYVVDERFFVSYQEVQCYKYLKYIGIPPGKMHHEYRIGKKHIDFFPLKRVFWEHHPIVLKLGHNIYKYGKQRRAILDKHGYSHIPLIISDTMFEDVPDICQKMREHNIDFRKGKVPNDTGIIYVRDYTQQYKKEWYPMLAESIPAT
ncbi:MAG: hypothetical protein NWE89_01880 [Candidatus Bathyarchaeota archaeon]|nr:hypothetical protein [Candidatus Bathyarchaeota archaeon]